MSRVWISLWDMETGHSDETIYREVTVDACMKKTTPCSNCAINNSTHTLRILQYLHMLNNIPLHLSFFSIQIYYMYHVNEFGTWHTNVNVLSLWTEITIMIMLLIWSFQTKLKSWHPNTWRKLVTENKKKMDSYFKNT